jgi:hypothetical protein
MVDEVKDGPLSSLYSVMVPSVPRLTPAVHSIGITPLRQGHPRACSHGEVSVIRGI